MLYCNHYKPTLRLKRGKVYHSGELNNKGLSKKIKRKIKRRSMIASRISETKRCGRLPLIIFTEN